MTPRLQRVLDALSPSPAIIRTATWDVVAWNGAPPPLLTDYALLPPDQRNILRLMFAPGAKRRQEDWQSVARYVVGAFRADTARAGAGAESEVRRLVEELSRTQSRIRRAVARQRHCRPWRGREANPHPEVGLIEVEFSAFAVDGRPDLGMLVFNPVTEEAASLLNRNPARSARADHRLDLMSIASVWADAESEGALSLLISHPREGSPLEEGKGPRLLFGGERMARFRKPDVERSRGPRRLPDLSEVAKGRLHCRQRKMRSPGARQELVAPRGREAGYVRIVELPAEGRMQHAEGRLATQLVVAGLHEAAKSPLSSPPRHWRRPPGDSAATCQAR